MAITLPNMVIGSLYHVNTSYSLVLGNNYQNLKLTGLSSYQDVLGEYPEADVIHQNILNTYPASKDVVGDKVNYIYYKFKLPGADTGKVYFPAEYMSACVPTSNQNISIEIMEVDTAMATSIRGAFAALNITNYTLKLT